MPFQTALSEGFRPGKALYVSGVINEKANRFAFNFLTRNGDNAFHLNVRFDEKVNLSFFDPYSAPPISSQQKWYQYSNPIVESRKKFTNWWRLGQSRRERRSISISKRADVWHNCAISKWWLLCNQHTVSHFRFSPSTETVNYHLTQTNGIFQVFVDGQPYCSYKHRMNVADVEAITIEGDVELQGVHWWTIPQVVT